MPGNCGTLSNSMVCCSRGSDLFSSPGSLRLIKFSYRWLFAVRFRSALCASACVRLFPFPFPLTSPVCTMGRWQMASLSVSVCSCAFCLFQFGASRVQFVSNSWVIYLFVGISAGGVAERRTMFAGCFRLCLSWFRPFRWMQLDLADGRYKGSGCSCLLPRSRTARWMLKQSQFGRSGTIWVRTELGLIVSASFAWTNRHFGFVCASPAVCFPRAVGLQGIR